MLLHGTGVFLLSPRGAVVSLLDSGNTLCPCNCLLLFGSETLIQVESYKKKGENSTSTRKLSFALNHLLICSSRNEQKERCDPRCEVCARKTAMERRITLDGTNTMKYHRVHWEKRQRGQRQAGQTQLQRIYANRQ